MEVVLVHWRIFPDRLDDFLKKYGSSLPEGTPGFLGEVLYRKVSDEASAPEFVRIGRWRRREDFYKALGITPDTRPDKEPFEAHQRRREWLAFIIEDGLVP